MKFTHASIFLALVHFKAGSASFVDSEDVDDEDRRRRAAAAAPPAPSPPPAIKIDRTDDIDKAKVYLDDVYPTGYGVDYDRTVYESYAKNNLPHWKNVKVDEVYQDAQGVGRARLCFAQGHPIGYDHDQNSNHERDQERTLAKCANGKKYCKEQCCSRRTTQRLFAVSGVSEVCDCLGKGEIVHDRSAAGTCCSMIGILQDDGETVKCAGIPPLVSNQHLIINKPSLIRLKAENCMYPDADEMFESDDTDRSKLLGTLNTKVCGLRPCQRKFLKPSGVKDVCCGMPGKWNRKADPPGQLCGCTVPGDSHDGRMAAKESDCCSGEYVKSSKECACIKSNFEVPEGAEEKHCCTKKIITRKGKRWCAADTCTAQGEVMGIGDGNYCCARDSTKIEYPKGKPCGCVWGGMAPKPAGKRERCCSGRLETDGTCSWIPHPGTIDAWMNETECFSGEVDDNNKCKCMAPLSTKRGIEAIKKHPQECCSKSIISTGTNKGLCSCIKSGRRLGFGSDESHCCSGKAKNGVCLCTLPGGAFKSADGMAEGDCCSSSAGEHFCKCSEKDSSTALEACCGGVNGGTCSCIKDGYLVPTSDAENADKVCCNNPKDTCSRTCGH